MRGLQRFFGAAALALTAACGALGAAKDLVDVPLGDDAAGSDTVAAETSAADATNGDPGAELQTDTPAAGDVAEVAVAPDVTAADAAPDDTTKAPGCSCGDGNCNSSAGCGETLAACPVDCKFSGDGICSPGESPKTAKEDCCKGSCGDGVCKGYDCGENPETCPADCGKACGNQLCEKGETPAVCPEDCKHAVCGNNACEPEDGGPKACPQDCAGSCGDCKCEKGEDFTSCPIDCGYCGDNICSNCGGQGESKSTCPADCKSDGCKDGCSDGVGCTKDICDSGGACLHLPDVKPCDDGQLCTVDTCDPLLGCLNKPGPATFCADDGNKCTDDVCDAGSCAHLANAATCTDDNACTAGDGCQNGACHAGSAKNCDDSNVCSNDACQAGVCVHLPSSATCDDGNGCTVGDYCSGGACVASPMFCNDGNPCTNDACFVDACVHLANAATCDDGNGCTQGDTCSQSACVSASQQDCGDGNPCTADSCVNSTCTHAANTAPCDDSDGCSIDDACLDGVCLGGGLLDCDDNNACSNDVCQGGGCKHLANAAPCDDGDPCTVADACAATVCGGTALWCNDGNSCTADSCADGKCQHANSSDACDDGKACTWGDHCQDGTCISTSANCPCLTAGDCTDNNACTLDACDTASGVCKNVPVPCDDLNDCTDDTCNAITGTCANVNNDLLVPDVLCPPDACNLVAPVCAGGKGGCAITGVDPTKEGLSCGGGAFCKSGVCLGNLPPSVTSAALSGMPAKAGASVTLTASVRDVNSSVSGGIDDIASVTVDASGIGGSASQALTWSASGADDHSAVYTVTLATAGLQEGAWLLPITATDKGGRSGQGLGALLVYTGQLLHVGAGQSYTTLKAGIAAAQNGDALLVHDGTYTGSNNKNLALGGKKILVVGQNGPGAAILDCQNNLRAFSLNNSGETPQAVIANLTLQNCAAGAIRASVDQPAAAVAATIVGCVFANNTDSEAGGAISAFGSSVNLSVALCAFHDNGTSGAAFAGGAISVHGGNLTLRASQFTGNSASAGGAVAVDSGGSVSASGCDFTANTGASGGAFSAQSQAVLTVSDSHFVQNTSTSPSYSASHGGAIYSESATVAVSGSSFVQNSANASGSGIDVATGSLQLDGCTFGGHTHSAVHAQGAQVSAANCTFSGNTCEGGCNGAAFSAVGGSAILTASTFAKNTTIGGGGAVAFNGSCGGCAVDATVSGCTFSGNSSGGDGGALSMQGMKTALISATHFDGNSSGGNGGAIAGQVAKVSACTFAANKAGQSGGAIAADSVGVWADSTFAGNSAKSGGAIWLGGNSGVSESVVGHLRNLLIHDNKADKGGGIYFAVGNYAATKYAGIFGVDIHNATIANNTAVQGGGVYVEKTASRIDSSIIWGNAATGSVGAPAHQVYVDAQTPDIGLGVKRTLIANGSGDISDDAGKINNQAFYGGDSYGNLDDDPLFVSGKNGDYYLAQTGAGQSQQSPAVDSGKPGSTTAAAAGVDARTTSSGDGADVGVVDFGYHFARVCPLGSALEGVNCGVLVSALSAGSAMAPAFAATTTTYSATSGGSAGLSVTATAAGGVQLTASVNNGAAVTLQSGVAKTLGGLAFGVNSVDIVATKGGAGGVAYHVSVLRTVAGTYTKASNTDASDWFGTAVAIDGDTVVVGAPGEDGGATDINGDDSDNSKPDSGAVYVFVRKAGAWSQQAYLKPATSDISDGFGAAVAISGDTLAVGVPADDAGSGDATDNGTPDAGAVVIFVRSGTTWTQQAFLKASNPDSADHFGGVLALSGNTLAVGAPGEDGGSSGINGDASDNTKPDSGAVYVLTRSGATWSQQAYVKASQPDAYDVFGTSLGLSGESLLIGAPGESGSGVGVGGNPSDNSAPADGAAYVFVRNGSAWSQQAYLKAALAQNLLTFGSSVAIAGDLAAIGAPGQFLASFGTTGAVYTFVRVGTLWAPAEAIVPLILSSGDTSFGASLALGDGQLLVGSGHESSGATGLNGDALDTSAQSAGAAWLFVHSLVGWSQTAYLKAKVAEANDRFGAAVAMSGSTLVVNAPDEDGAGKGLSADAGDNSGYNAGACTIYE